MSSIKPLQNEGTLEIRHAPLARMLRLTVAISASLGRMPRVATGIAAYSARIALLSIGLAAVLCAGQGTFAQDACRTANCAPPGSIPLECQNRAVPYTLQVNFVGTNTATYAFSPNKPKIEFPGGTPGHLDRGECIRWQQTNIITAHDSTHSVCNDDNLCMFAPAPNGCNWDTGNVATATNTSRTCYYPPGTFPVTTATGTHFYCRLHAAPNDTTGMVGDLRVTTTINLSVHRTGNNVVVSWTGGGVTGSFTYDVLRSLNDTKFTSFTTLATGTIAGNTFTDMTATCPTEPHCPGRLYSYLIRNKN